MVLYKNLSTLIDFDPNYKSIPSSMHRVSNDKIAIELVFSDSRRPPQMNNSSYFFYRFNTRVRGAVLATLSTRLLERGSGYRIKLL